MAGVAAALLAMTVAPVAASADSGSGHSADNSGSKHSPTALMNGYHRQLIGMTESDPWFFDDGCIGGTSKDDPLYMVVPSTDPPTSESACSVSDDARIVITAAGLTCWQPTLTAARDECEAAWADPTTVLVQASVTIDGKAKKLSLFAGVRKPHIPRWRSLRCPGHRDRVLRHRVGSHRARAQPGVHQVSVAFLYADGFEGATTFALTVVKD